MQAKQRIKVKAKDGRVVEATAKVNAAGVVMVKGSKLQLDPAKVAAVVLETVGEDGRVTAQACRITSGGVVKVGAVASKAAAPAAAPSLSDLAPKGEGKAAAKRGLYEQRAQASLARNDERKGWELRLRKGDQLDDEQLRTLRGFGWHWFGGRLQAFCLADKYQTREGIVYAQGLVTGFNSGVLHKAAELATFAADVAAGKVQGSSALAQLA